jgi:hypothetical protein
VPAAVQCSAVQPRRASAQPVDYDACWRVAVGLRRLQDGLRQRSEVMPPGRPSHGISEWPRARGLPARASESLGLSQRGCSPRTRHLGVILVPVPKKLPQRLPLVPDHDLVHTRDTAGKGHVCIARSHTGIPLLSSRAPSPTFAVGQSGVCGNGYIRLEGPRPRGCRITHHCGPRMDPAGPPN